MIKFSCKKCGQKLNVEDKHSGKQVKCPKCGSVGVVPDKSTRIKFHCKDCSQSISVPQIHAGKKGRCPKCKHPVVIPSPDKGPADAAETFTIIVCSMCNETIHVPQSSRGQTIECPSCGSYIETTSERVAGESDTSIPPSDEEDQSEEETESYEESEGVDRHFIVVISCAAAAVVIGLVFLGIVLRFIVSRPSKRPEVLRSQQQIADADSQPRTVASDTQSTEPVVQEPSPKTDFPGSELPVKLRQKFPPGKYRLEVIHTMTVKGILTAESSTAKTGESQEKWWYEIDASEPDASGQTTCIATFKRIISSDSEGSSYDTDDPDSLRADDFEQIIRKIMVNKQYVFKLGQDGSIVSVEGLDRLWESISNEVSKNAAKAFPMDSRRAAQVGRQVVQQLKQEADVLGDKGYIKSLLGLVYDIMPDKPVGVGAVWHKVNSENIPLFGTTEYSAEYKLIKIEQNGGTRIAHITCVGSKRQEQSKKTQLGPVSMTINNAHSKRKGEIQLNVDTGLVISSRLESDGVMEGSVVVSGKNVDTNTQINSVTETKARPVIDDRESEEPAAVPIVQEPAPRPIVQEPSRRIRPSTQRRTYVPARRRTVPVSNALFSDIVVGLIGLLLAAVVLRAAAQWVASIDVAFWDAYATLFIAWIINLGIGLLFGFIVGPAAPFIGFPIGVLVQLCVIKWRLSVGFGKAILISLMMVVIWIGILMIGLAVGRFTMSMFL